MFCQRIQLLIAFFLCFSISFLAAKDEKECEVCVKVMGDIEKFLQEEPKRTQEAAENAITKKCDKKKMNPQELKLCYNLLPMKGDIARQLQFKKPHLSICRSSAKKNTDFCTIRFPLTTDETTDYSKLRVKDLKRILQEREIKCMGCVEKKDFIQRIKETEGDYKEL